MFWVACVSMPGALFTSVNLEARALTLYNSRLILSKETYV